MLPGHRKRYPGNVWWTLWPKQMELRIQKEQCGKSHKTGYQKEGGTQNYEDLQKVPVDSFSRVPQSAHACIENI